MHGLLGWGDVYMQVYTGSFDSTFHRYTVDNCSQVC